LEAAQAHEAQCRQRLDRAEVEVLKARTVSESAHAEARKAEARDLQRQVDNTSIQRHWLARLSRT
jgi:hypothetical protein